MNRMNGQQSFFQSHKWLIIVLLVVAVLALGSESGAEKVDDSFTPSGDINNIKVVAGDADVKINFGDSFYVDGIDLRKDDYEFSQDGDTLNVISDKDDINNHFFNFNFNFWDESPQITITIPEKRLNKLSINTGSGRFTSNTGLNVSDVEIKIGSGDVKMDALTGDSLSVEIGSGELGTKDITVNEVGVNLGSGDADCGYIESISTKVTIGSGSFNFKSLEADTCKIKLGSGDASGKNISVKDMTGDVGSGSINLIGELTGNSQFSCGSGDIDLKLTGNVEDYYLDLDGEDIEINNKEYRGKYKSDQLSDKQLHLDCSSGSIDVKIN